MYIAALPRPIINCKLVAIMGAKGPFVRKMVAAIRGHPYMTSAMRGGGGLAKKKM